MANKTKSAFPFLEEWLELSKKVKDAAKLQELGLDHVTGLPTVPLLLDSIKQQLQEKKQLGLICVDVVRYSRIEEIYGWQAYDGLMKGLASIIKELPGHCLRDADSVSRLMISGSAFVLLISPPRRKTALEDDDFAQIKRRVKDHLEERIRQKLSPSLHETFGCYVGGAVLKETEQLSPDRLIYRGLESALQEAEDEQAKDAGKRARVLQQIIEEERIHILYQPIVNLATRQIIGYEALSRGPAETEFERPGKLFRVAYEADLVLKLERLCRRKALQGAERLAPRHLLFLNVEPESVEDFQLRQVVSGDLLEPNLSLQQIVLEITERSAVTSFGAFSDTVEYFRGLGFKISIDDASGGYTSLQCVAELIPDFVKADMSLTRGIDKDPVKQQLVRTFSNLAERANVTMAAEGIETIEEYKTLIKLGVQVGQGYLLAYPAEPFPPLREIE
jgi:EAL domain-containing protein (putative c-di-GMP-specific phosphodiesterase class I)/GGDEF domain-containing protein